MNNYSNLLVVVLDTARADAFEPYGAPAGATPALRQLADAGTFVPFGYATSPWTVPSHLSMMSGLLPSQSGLGDEASTVAGIRRVLGRLQPGLLPEVLRAHGYRTVGVSANSWISPTTGFDLGFDEFHLVANPRAKTSGPSSLRRASHALHGLRAVLDAGAEQAKRTIIDARKRSGSVPFFGFVNLMECHSPYLPPKPFNPFRAVDRLRAVGDNRRFCNFEAFARSAGGDLTPPPDVVDRLARAYGGCIRLMDDWVARLLDELDDAGLLEETQVIVCSDHGESLGEGGRLGHHFTLEERLLRVPVVTAGPLDLGTGAMMSLADLPGAIAHALDLRSPEAWDLPVSRDIVVAEVDPPVTTLDLSFAGAEGASPSEAQRFLPATSATDGHLKLIRTGGREVVFDLTLDPLELEPLPADPQDPGAAAEQEATIERLRRVIDAARKREERNGTTPASAPTSPFATDDDLEHSLRFLGYL